MKKEEIDDLLSEVASFLVSARQVEVWRRFMERHEGEFLSGGEQEQEHSLEQTRIHRMFEELVEKSLEEWLADRHGLSVADFYEACRDSEFAKVVVLATDFPLFCDVMGSREKRDSYFRVLEAYTTLRS
ncbi:hypothetical protein CTAYLR_005703 [Chrysophaeum taylorii]|uniref:BART domain-containing protein n=1 Tax=Chrysophaeum taylorii TaxID=2483200 RepID=A0AAD7UD14_9STRA|nr:hypothetical protein CTAYLR_005703 [Chrysophaeum taylorii]